MVHDKVNLKDFYIDEKIYHDAKILSEDDFAEYINKAGVWACWGKDKKDKENSQWVCLNVGSGKTIGIEMRGDLKYSRHEFNHKRGVYKNYLGKEVFTFDRPMNEPITIRERVWDHIGHNYTNLVFVIVLLSADEGEEKSLEAERLEVEKKYAHDHEAMYWNPSPRQK